MNVNKMVEQLLDIVYTQRSDGILEEQIVSYLMSLGSTREVAVSLVAESKRKIPIASLEEFWLHFEAFWAPRLAHRSGTFRKMLKRLDGVSGPCVLETGCARSRDNIAGDGCSTLLFAQYLKVKQGQLKSIDIDPAACSLGKEMGSILGESHQMICADSVFALRKSSSPVDLLYLDSYDIDWKNPFPSAFHHVKEFLAAQHIIHPRTVVVVDDNLMQDGVPIGKGMLLFEYFNNIGIKPLFVEYQIGWEI